MQNRRKLFIILALFSLIFSMSIVVAGDNVTSDTTNQDTVLSVTDDINDVQEISVEKSQELELSSDDDQSDTINKSEKINDDTPSVLGVSEDEPVLGDVHVDDTVTTVAQLVTFIKNTQENVIFLDGKTFTRGEGSNNFGSLADKQIYGGSYIGDPTQAYFDLDGTALYANSLNNVRFDGLKAKDRLFWFDGEGSLTNVVINNCECVHQFMWIAGQNNQNGQKRVIGCNFTNIRQTYGLGNDSDYYDGNGQLGAVSGIYMENCNFINTTSGHHGGALCIADESEWGPSYKIGNQSYGLSSTIKNTNFINVTSRWFAVYLHGSFRTSGGHYVDTRKL